MHSSPSSAVNKAHAFACVPIRAIHVVPWICALLPHPPYTKYACERIESRPLSLGAVNRTLGPVTNTNLAPQKEDSRVSRVSLRFSLSLSLSLHGAGRSLLFVDLIGSRGSDMAQPFVKKDDDLDEEGRVETLIEPSSLCRIGGFLRFRLK